MQTRCSTYLTIAYRLMRNIRSTREYSRHSFYLATETKMDDYIAVTLSNLSWSYFSEAKYHQAASYLDQSLTHWNDVATRFEYPFLWLSHLQAIALCGMNEEFADKYLIHIPNFASILLDTRQVSLPKAIENLLIQLSDTRSISHQMHLIEPLIKTAVEYRLL